MSHHRHRSQQLVQISIASNTCSEQNNQREQAHAWTAKVSGHRSMYDNDVCRIETERQRDNKANRLRRRAASKTGRTSNQNLSSNRSEMSHLPDTIHGSCDLDLQNKQSSPLIVPARWSFIGDDYPARLFAAAPTRPAPLALITRVPNAVVCQQMHVSESHRQALFSRIQVNGHDDDDCL